MITRRTSLTTFVASYALLVLLEGIAVAQLTVAAQMGLNQEYIHSVAFSHDGRLVAAGFRGGAVRVWDAQSREEAFRVGRHAETVYSLAFSPDGSLLATGGRDGLRLWKGSEYQEEVRLPDAPRNSFVTELCFGEKNQTLLVTAFHDAFLVDVGTGKVTSIEKQRVSTTALSPDGSLVAVGFSGAEVGFWNTKEHRYAAKVCVLPKSVRNLNNLYSVSSIDFSPDGKYVAIACSVKGPSVVVIWNIESSKVAHVVHNSNGGPIYCVAYSPKGRFLAFCVNRKLKLWDVTNNHSAGEWLAPGEDFQHPFIPHEIAFSPTRKIIATGGASGLVRLFMWGSTDTTTPQVP